MTSKLCNAFLNGSRGYKTRCICLKLFTHRPEPIVKIEAYRPYRQSVVVILSIVMMMWLLWLPFNNGSGYFAGPGKIAPRSYFAGPGKIVPRSYFAGPGKIAILDL